MGELNHLFHLALNMVQYLSISQSLSGIQMQTNIFIRHSSVWQNIQRASEGRQPNIHPPISWAAEWEARREAMAYFILTNHEEGTGWGMWW